MECKTKNSIELQFIGRERLLLHVRVPGLCTQLYLFIS